MNKILSILMLFVIMPLMAQTTKSIQLSYSSSDFTLETDNGFTFIESNIHDIYFTTDTLSPALPHITVNVLIEPNQSYISHSVQKTLQSMASNVLIVPNSAEISDSLSNDVPEPSNVSYSGVYPSSNIEFIGEELIDGAKLLVFDICPFSYNSNNNTLSIVSSLTLSITLNEVSKQRSGGTSDCLNNMYSVVNDLVVNPEDLEASGSAYVKPIAPVVPVPINTDGYEYVIVTTNALKSEFQRLADWKTQKGIKSKVITIEEINTQYSQFSSQELRIKYALKNYYDGEYTGLKYALLAGGHQQVPSPLCYASFLSHNTYTPTDLFYACFNTMNWDLNNNGKWGEVLDHVDLYPEIFITRLPAQNTSDANIMVNKIIGYESTPNINEWNNRILMGGNKLRKIKGGQSDAEYRGDKIYTNFIPSNWGGTKVKFYDTGTSFTGGANYNFTAANLKSVLSDGYPFVYIYTHGSCNSWKMETGSSFFASEIWQFSCPIYSIITTNSCHTNSFDTPQNETCLGESFIREPNSGAVGYWGSSRVQYSCGLYKRLSSANEFVGNFYKSLFSRNEKNFGSAINYARLANMGRCNKTTVYSTRYTLFTFNALGDPEMPVYTQTPSTFTNATVSLSNDQISVSTGASSCSICVMSNNEGVEPYYCVVRDVSSYTFNVSNSLASDFVVTISKPGYVVYSVNINRSDIYIQNKTFTTNTTVTSNNIFVGRNVTTMQPEGDVIVNNGTLTLQGQNKVKINNGFKVNLGGQLKIN